MLFYTTEGAFGEDNFSVTAKGLFLLDIGTATYTEYDPSDPEVIKFLMANPNMLAMKKGHIHSHNNMGVFFSQTDDNELIDNCGFHNFYLSLIVNNKNEMCAKIAFKAKTKSENRVTMTFLDENGKEKNKDLVGNKEHDAIYTYKCDIFRPVQEVDEAFMSRFQEVKKAKEEKAAAQKGPEAYAIPQMRSKDWINGDSWRQRGLFDDTRPPKPSGKKKDKKSVVGDYAGGKVGRSDPRVYSMLTKLLALDPLYEGGLHSILKKFNEEFYPGEEDYIKARDPFGPHLYYDTIEKRCLDFYMDHFPEDMNLREFSPVLEICTTMLEFYEEEFPELVSNLVESLSLEIKE
jgi:hypothetical protein